MIDGTFAERGYAGSDYPASTLLPETKPAQDVVVHIYDDQAACGRGRLSAQKKY